MTRLRHPTLAFLLMTAVATAGCGDKDGASTTPNPPSNGSGGRGMGGRTGTGGTPAGTGGMTGTPGTGGMTGDGGVTPTDGANALGGPAVGNPLPVADTDWTWLTKKVPVLWFTTESGMGVDGIAKPGLPKAMRTLGRVKILQEHDGTALTDVAGKAAALDAPVLLEGRGSSSYGALGNYGIDPMTKVAKFGNQRGYGFEFHDGTRNPVGHSVLGMPKDPDWAMVPCFTEKTCVRNALTYAIAREVNGDARWAPRFRWAEVYVDGKYNGLYTITEKPKDDKTRVNLPGAPPGAPPEELSYMISANGDAASLRWDPIKNNEGFMDARGRLATMEMMNPVDNRRWKFREPASEIMTEAQRMYIIGNFDKLHAAIEAFTPGWKDLIDQPSWIDYMAISEFTNNVDAFFKSWYFYKLPQSLGGKWFMGPVWDFDLAYGNANYYMRHCATTSVIGPIAKKTPMAGAQDRNPPPFVLKVQTDPAFRTGLRCRWNELRKAGGPLDVMTIEKKITDYTAHIKEAVARHTARAKNIGEHIWPNNYVGATYEDEVTYLRFWIRKRLAWVDSRLPGTCTATPAPAAVAQITAPPSKKVDRSIEPWGGESLDRHNDYVDIDATTPPEWSCPR